MLPSASRTRSVLRRSQFVCAVGFAGPADLEPGVLPGDKNRVQVAADTRRDALGPCNFRRLMLIQWIGKRRADASVFLAVVVLPSIYDRTAAAVKRRVT